MDQHLPTSYPSAPSTHSESTNLITTTAAFQERRTSQSSVNLLDRDSITSKADSPTFSKPYRTSSFKEEVEEDEPQTFPQPYHTTDSTRRGSTTNGAKMASKFSPTSPKIPLFRKGSGRPSMAKFASSGSQSGINSVDLPRGSVEDTDTLATAKPHMIRGKWVAARFRTVFYMFMWAAALTTFILVVGVWRVDYLPHKNEISSPRMYKAGNYTEMPDNMPGRGLRVRAWPTPSEIDLNGVYLIIAWCGTGTLLFFALWLQNTYRPARSYYVKFSGWEKFELLALIIYGIGFGATAGYVTYTFKLDNNNNDFWSYTCTRVGMAQEVVYKSTIYYDGDCHMLTGSWGTILTLCGFCLLATLTFPINLIYHARTKGTHYSRFEERISKAADQEDRLLRRMSLRPRENWKMPKWAKVDIPGKNWGSG